MKRKLLWIPVALLSIGCGEVAYLSMKQPDMAPPLDIKVDMSPERVARGRYLVNHVSICADCHSDVDETKFGSPVKPGGLLKGRPFPKEMGLPGEFWSTNLTSHPTGNGRMTDGQLIRAVREGIGHDGRVLFPFMPYLEYAALGDDDVQSIVAYLRTVPGADNNLPTSKVMFPVNLFIKGVPKPVGKVHAPNRSSPVEYGKYLATVAGCKFCHTPVKDNQPVQGREFAGGHEFGAGEFRALTANLTPHRETGLGNWSEEQFLKKFYDYKEYAEKGPPSLKPENFTVMPWLNYSGMEPDDLKAIFAYLRTVPAVESAIETRPGAKKDKS